MELTLLAENLTSNEGHAVAAIGRAVATLRELGLVVTVENRPLLPLAMGHHEPHITVRRAIDHKAEAAKRGGYAIGPKCAHCGRRAGQEPCDWIECAALSEAPAINGGYALPGAA